MSLEDLWKRYQGCLTFNFSHLSDAVKKSAVQVVFEPNATITTAGEYPKFVYFITSGIVQGSRLYQNGNCYHYFVLTKEDGSVGMLELLAHESRYVATILALTQVTAYRVDAPAIYELVMSDPNLLRCCLHRVSRDLYLRSGNDGLLYYQNGASRVRFFLIAYYRDHAKEKETIPLQIDYQTLANNIGVSLRTVGRSIQQLKGQNLLTLQKKKIFISYDQFMLLRQLQ